MILFAWEIAPRSIPVPILYFTSITICWVRHPAATLLGIAVLSGVSILHHLFPSVLELVLLVLQLTA